MSDGSRRATLSASVVLRRATSALGVLVCTGAVLVDRLGGGTSGIGATQLLVLGLGLLLVAAAWLGPRAPAAYRGLGLLLLNTLVVLVLVDLAAIVALRATPAADPAAELRQRYTDASYFRDKPWAETLQTETWTAAAGRPYAPFTGWMQHSFRGRFVRVGADRLRWTPGAACGPGAFRVFVFGGSTIWGWLAPDSATAPAYLQAALAASNTGMPVCVVNYGQLAWNSTQERIELERQVAAGNIPDVAVFWDGFNDCNVAGENGEAGVPAGNARLAAVFARGETPTPAWRSLWQQSAIYLLGRRLMPGRPSDKTRPLLAGAQLDSLAAQVSSEYLANVRILDALAHEFDFEVHVFLQPWKVSGHHELSDEERRQPPAASRPLCARTYSAWEAASRTRGRLHDATDLFDTVTGTIYFDDVHPTPPGNALVARRMLSFLVPGEARAGARSHS